MQLATETDARQIARMSERQHVTCAFARFLQKYSFATAPRVRLRFVWRDTKARATKQAGESPSTGTGLRTAQNTSEDETAT